VMKEFAELIISKSKQDRRLNKEQYN